VTAEGKPGIPIASADPNGNQERYVLEAVHSSWLSSTGAYVDRFERESASAFGTRA
jgi:perosamine synthetase